MANQLAWERFGEPATFSRPRSGSGLTLEAPEELVAEPEKTKLYQLGLKAGRTELQAELDAARAELAARDAAREAAAAEAGARQAAALESVHGRLTELSDERDKLGELVSAQATAVLREVIGKLAPKLAHAGFSDLAIDAVRDCMARLGLAKVELRAPPSAMEALLDHIAGDETLADQVELIEAPDLEDLTLRLQSPGACADINVAAALARIMAALDGLPGGDAGAEMNRSDEIQEAHEQEPHERDAQNEQ